MDRDKALEKIKKCLALAGSSEPHEAAAAMRQAQKLMAEHGLSGIDVELADVAESKASAKSNLLPNWEVSLARVVANSFGCDFYINRSLAQRFMMAPERKTDYTFVGLHANAQIASYAFSVLQRQCIADRLAHVKKQPKRLKSTTRTARGDAFAVGWVAAVRDLLDKLAGCERHAELIEHYMGHTHPDMAEASVQRRELNRHVRDDSFSDGHQAGKKAQLRKGVSAAKTNLLT
jgi:uncharacterized protein (DUF433 family)